MGGQRSFQNWRSVHNYYIRVLEVCEQNLSVDNKRIYLSFKPGRATINRSRENTGATPFSRMHLKKIA